MLRPAMTAGCAAFVLVVGCERPPHETPGSGAVTRESDVPPEELAGAESLQQATLPDRGVAGPTEDELSESRATLAAILPPELTVLRSEVASCEDGNYLLIHVGPGDQARAHSGFALVLWPLSNRTTAPWAEGKGTHTFVFLGRSDRYALYYGGQGGLLPAADPVMRGMADKIRNSFSVVER